MPLVEVIRGEQTSDETLAWALDYIQAIGKTPVVVNDRRGFYTSRVFATYVTEGMVMLIDGVLPALVENAGRRTGMPMPPLSRGIRNTCGQKRWTSATRSWTQTWRDIMSMSGACEMRATAGCSGGGRTSSRDSQA